jgi:hypothetical protein
MGDISQFIVLGLGIFMLVFYRRIHAILHDLSVLTRAFRKEFSVDKPLAPKVRPERQPENIS